MSFRVRSTSALAVARSSLGRLFIAAVLLGVLAFALIGQTPASGAPKAPAGQAWLLPTLASASASTTEEVWSRGVWSTQPGPAAEAAPDAPRRLRLTLLGVVQRGGRFEAILLTEDAQRLRHVAGDALPGGATLVRVSPTEVVWADSLGRETVVRVLSAPDASSAEAGPAPSP
jgi:hypothetical protein